MDAVEQFENFRRALIGRNITFVRLACDMLLLYVECEPGDGRGLTFWLNPTWHVSTPEGVVAGSRQAQGEGDAEPTEEELNRMSEPIVLALLNRPIKTIQIDPRSRDLAVTVEDGNCFRTFVCDPGDEHTWHIRENSTGLKLYASPLSLEIRKGNA